MSYTVKSSEKTVKSGAEGETKALLYLMNLRSDSDEINYFVVDFFNDLTGMDRYADKLWDIQSKAEKNLSPNKVGQALVTLYKNYISCIKFKYYILFVGGVSDALRIDNSKAEFGIANIKESSLKKVRAGLVNEAKGKSYIDNSLITDDRIDEFLKKVLFVIDNKASNEYVKAIIKDHPKIIPEDKILEAIFNEIRDEQSSKKNIFKVEGIVIETAGEALNYFRHLTASEIRLMVLHRIINRNPIEKGIPVPFLPIYNAVPPEKQSDLIDECKQTLCRALFNKSAAKSFWTLFEAIYNEIVSYPANNIDKIYNSIDIGVKMSNPDFDIMSLKYFISVIKEGIQ
ncbi:MAG: hypothetical protein HFK07_06765 [Clostridia bacterium]|jgi:hypothetical protein|nr:hypothetical protein [Clostridia bacterium]